MVKSSSKRIPRGETKKWLKPMRKKAEDQKKKLMAKQKEAEQRIKNQEQRIKDQERRIEMTQKETIIDTILESKTRTAEEDFTLFLTNIVDKYRAANSQLKKQYHNRVVAMLRVGSGGQQRTPRRASIIDVKNAQRLVEFGDRLMEVQEKGRALEMTRNQEEARHAGLLQQHTELSKQHSDSKRQGVYEGNDHSEVDEVGSRVEAAEKRMEFKRSYCERFTPLTQVAASGLKSLLRKVQAVTNQEVFLDDSDDIDIPGSLDYIESRVQQLADILGDRLPPFSLLSLDHDAAEIADLASRGEVVLPHLADMEGNELSAGDMAEAAAIEQGIPLENYDFKMGEGGAATSRAESRESEFNKRRPSSRSKARIS